MTTKTRSVMIVAGEASGDMHGAELVKRLREIDSNLSFSGMGSKHLKNAEVELFIDSANIAVVGLVEVLAHWNDIKAALNTMHQAIIEQKPDLLILIDYQEFNLKLAKTAKENNVKVLFYVSPQVWAWRPKRVYKIGKLIDMMAVVFPFEVDFYKKANVPVRFVGHPLANKVKPSLAKDKAIHDFGLDPNKKIVSLLPGSRQGEIKRILPILLKTAELIKQSINDVQFVLAIAPTLSKNFLQPYLQESKVEITPIEGQAYDVMNIAEAVITASGTATLEVALIGTPMAIVYKISPLSYFIMSRMITVDDIGLANIVAEKRIVPEFLQNKAQPNKIAKEIIHQLTDTIYTEKIKQELSKVQEKLGEGNNSTAIAQLAKEMLDQV